MEAQPVPRVCALAAVSCYKLKKEKKKIITKQTSKFEFLTGDLSVLPAPKLS